MLNEAWRLWKALERCGLNPKPKHKRVHTPGRSVPCLRVRLSRGGKVASIEEVSQDDWPGWTIMEGNKNSFPVVRVAGPLIEAPFGDKVWREMNYSPAGKRQPLPSSNHRLNALDDILHRIGIESHLRRTKKLWKRLRNIKAAELLAVSKEGGTGLKVVEALAERFFIAACYPDKILWDVAEISIRSLKGGQLSSLDTVQQLLIGTGLPGRDGKRPGSVVQLAFDVELSDLYPTKLYSEAVKTCLIERLPHDQSFRGPRISGTDGLTGETGEIEVKNFATVELPVAVFRKKIGGVPRKSFPLTSMFREAQCNKRYGMTDAKVFPMLKGRDVKLKEALEYITADDLQKKTWQHVASGHFENGKGIIKKIEKPDLLIAYVEEKPNLDAKTAGYFGAGPGVCETQFKVEASVVCDALNGLVRSHPKSCLHLFLIRNVSKGQAQVVLSSTPTVKEVLSSAKIWQSAAEENVPKVRLMLPSEKGKALEEGRPVAIFPDTIVSLLSYQWIRDGSSQKKSGIRVQDPKQPVIAPDLGDVLTIMFRSQGKWQQTAYRLLALLLQRVTPLLVGVFGAQHAFGPRMEQHLNEPLFDYPRSSRVTALNSITALGIFLDALECQKEAYMENAPYQIGQLLALADALHKNYCVVVRRGNLPNSLIGASLMKRALVNPVAALAELAERILEYIRWAKTAEIPKNLAKDDKNRYAILEAHKRMHQFQPLAARLDPDDLPTECSDIMKAQLILGYLASLPD